MRVKCILPHCTNFQPKQLIRHKFLKMNSSKATEDDQRNDKKLGEKHNQRSATGLSRTGPRFSLLIFVVKDNFT